MVSVRHHYTLGLVVVVGGKGTTCGHYKRVLGAELGLNILIGCLFQGFFFPDQLHSLLPLFQVRQMRGRFLTNVIRLTVSQSITAWTFLIGSML